VKIFIEDNGVTKQKNILNPIKPIESIDIPEDYLLEVDLLEILLQDKTTGKNMALRHFVWVEYPDIYHLNVGIGIRQK